MISSIRGEVGFIGKNFVELLAGSVGYKIYVGGNLLSHVQVGHKLTLYTHLKVGEDSLDLFGVGSRPELEFFHELISVSGVGPRSALHVLELGSLEDIKKAVASGDINFLTRVSGIGRKIAERIVVELKNKLALPAATINGAPEERAVLGDIVEALVNMGYTAPQVRDALRQIDVSGRSTTEIIKAVLKILQQR